MAIPYTTQKHTLFVFETSTYFVPAKRVPTRLISKIGTSHLFLYIRKEDG
jgi:hypothetical protein